MGWCTEDGTHEGYLVGIVADRRGWFLGAMTSRAVELGTLEDVEKYNHVAGPVQLRHVKVACSCGWRSPLLRAPSDASWAPNHVLAPAFEDRAQALWLKHALETGTILDGGLGREYRRRSISVPLGNNHRIEITGGNVPVFPSDKNEVQITKHCDGRSDLHLTRGEAWALLRALTEFLVTTIDRNEPEG